MVERVMPRAPFYTRYRIFRPSERRGNSSSRGSSNPSEAMMLRRKSIWRALHGEASGGVRRWGPCGKIATLSQKAIVPARRKIFLPGRSTPGYFRGFP